jgi:hypothetical protein
VNAPAGLLATAALVALVAGIAVGYAGPSLDPIVGIYWPGPAAWLALAFVSAAAAALLVAFGSWRWARLAMPVALLCFGLAREAAAVHHPGPGTVDGYLGATVRLDGSVESVSNADLGRRRFDRQPAADLPAVRSGAAVHAVSVGWCWSRLTARRRSGRASASASPAGSTASGALVQTASPSTAIAWSVKGSRPR